MTSQRIFFVHLRRPRRPKRNEEPEDFRTDPLYEFGSFGCTRCHKRTLMQVKNAEMLHGARFAFAQGGKDGFRLVYLTPPITVKVWADHCEATWTPAEMPFKYGEAPILVTNNGQSDFSIVKDFASDTRRTTLEGGFSSLFRSTAKPLPGDMANQIVSIYKSFRERSDASLIAKEYHEALPYFVKIDRNRKATYDELVRGLEAAMTKSKSKSSTLRKTKPEGKPNSCK